MEWYKILIYIFSGLGGLSGFISLYMAKPKRESIVITNLQNAVKTLTGQNQSMSAELKDVKKEVSTLKKREWINQRAINAAWRCRFPEKIEDCPVLQTSREECNLNDGVCSIK